MPVFEFTHDPTGETISVLVPITAPDTERHQQVKDGKVYKRVYAAPLAAVDLATRHGDATREDFRRVTTGKRHLKVGDMWEISAEMSEERRQRIGIDPVKEESYRRHEQEFGEKHPDVIRRERAEKANRELAEWGIRIKP